MAEPLNYDDIETFVKAWYAKLDVHAPMVELLPMLSENKLDMVFPEATLSGLAGFEGWYQGVIRIFFDEVHAVKTVEAEIDGDTARLHVVVHWEASVWKPPVAKSERISLDADQSWEVARGRSGGLVITRYVVNGFDYAEGSARL